MERLRGWAMGASFSEPVTMMDLGDDVFQVHRKRDVQKRCGWVLEGYQFDQLVAGVIHVDDCMLAPHVFCPHCLKRGLRKLWPRDVGVSLEGQSPYLDFLTVCVQVVDGDRWEIWPHNANVDFAIGRTSFQHFTKLSPYMGPFVHEYFDLRTFLLGKILTYNAIMCGNIPSNSQCSKSVVYLVMEAVRLGWDLVAIARVFRHIPRRHQSVFLRALRLFGKKLVHGVRLSHVQISFENISFHMLHDQLVAVLAQLGTPRSHICSCGLVPRLAHE